MSRKFITFLPLVLLFVTKATLLPAQARPSDGENQSISVNSAWKIAGLPNLSYDSDVGFRYGIIASLNYWDVEKSNILPVHAFNFEWSRTTLGNGINRLFYRSTALLPGIEVNCDLSYVTDKQLQFFGFNGYESIYNEGWENPSSDEYVSELFYRHDRKMFKFDADFKGLLFPQREDFYWYAGLTYLDIEVGSVDFESINKDRQDSERLDEVEVLYDKYVRWGIIQDWEASGDKVTYLKGGLIYDTSNETSFITKGIIADMIFAYTPSLPGDGTVDFLRASFFWKHYLPIDPEKLVFAYRLGYQGVVFGVVPFYLQPYIISSDQQSSVLQGLGGAKTLRGAMRNRVVGDGFVLGNAELRWKFLDTSMLGREFYLGLNIFADFGQVVDKIDFDVNLNEVKPDENLDAYFDEGSEKIHLTTGTGLKAGFNKYFVLSFDYGIATDNRDGLSGFYINLNWLF